MERSVQRIVVGVDGSAQARSALVWAATEPAARSAALEVVSVVPVDFHWGDDRLVDSGRISAMVCATEKQARSAVEEVRRDPAVAALPRGRGVSSTRAAPRRAPRRPGSARAPPRAG